MLPMLRALPILHPIQQFFPTSLATILKLHWGAFPPTTYKVATPLSTSLVRSSPLCQSCFLVSAKTELHSLWMNKCFFCFWNYPCEIIHSRVGPMLQIVFLFGLVVHRTFGNTFLSVYWCIPGLTIAFLQVLRFTFEPFQARLTK